jgi:predicted HAD superfamily phosphohydrolase YqeG
VGHEAEPKNGPEPSRLDWWQTVRQSLPVVWRVARNLSPAFEMRSLCELDEAFLERNGVRGILWDVDGTLTHYHAHEVAPEAACAAPLFANGKLRHAILSNSDDLRFAQLGRLFHGVPVLKLYEADGTLVGRRLEGGVEQWRGAPRPGMRALRKPNAALVTFAVAELGMEAAQVIMVGDQYWTDVAGANLGGVRSVHVPTIGRRTFPRAIRWMQRVEGWLRRVLA